MKLFVQLYVFVQAVYVIQASLEVVQDDELMNLIRTEKYVVVLFSRKYCESCDNYENELTSLREDLVETLNAWVIKIEDSSMTRLYNPDGEPSLVFFRHGIPLLYDGPLNDELILHTFTNSREPISKELTDESFEHLTQAGTGATTGDWFVMFYTSDCVDCARFQARWEAVGVHLKSRKNIARVNRATTGAATARRFQVSSVPTFILFRHGKMYRYNIQKYDIASLVSFAQNWFKNVTPEKIPLPKAPFDDFITSIADYFRDNPWLWLIALSTFIIGLIASLILKLIQKIPDSVPDSTLEKKKTKNKKEKRKDR